ncbi:hypothetical protein LTR09_007371 [Extremus antarcticus]|uniref:Uncharacterized protein n=1 Tax=Extremus antarcticus TaxID=702011 RepID=A0AAJ0DCH7_9PEZI|nr:hypothetical protein LTR09_007371 [Extremus antarcticus]
MEEDEKGTDDDVEVEDPDRTAEAAQAGLAALDEPVALGRGRGESALSSGPRSPFNKPFADPRPIPQVVVKEEDTAKGTMVGGVGKEDTTQPSCGLA